MISPKRGSVQSPYTLGFFHKLLLFPLGLFYRFWLSTIRFSFADPQLRIKVVENNHPVIITLWHNRLFLAGEWQRRYRKQRNCYGLISGSRDGAWLEAFYGWSGIRAIRGSKNRGGTQAIRDLVKTLKQGNDIGITPDGSRGPCYEAKPGCLLVGKLAKAPLLLLGFNYGGHWKLKSWDRFVIPYPFSRFQVNLEWVDAKELMKDLEVDEAVQQLGQKLMQVIAD